MGLRSKIRGLKRWQKILLSIILIALIALAVAYFMGVFDKEEPKPSEPPKKYYSQITGNETSEELSNRPILGVMIENSEEARPQVGLDDAGIVFETVTEGGITRYMAMYQETMPAELGPVRSVRPPFVNWITGFDSSIAHVGGSEPALALIDELNTKSLNEFKYPEPYYRVPSRAAPHNMFAKTDALRDLQKQLGIKKSEFLEIPRSSDTPNATPVAKDISLEFSQPLFSVSFRYDPATNSYQRFLAGTAHIDQATKKQITVKNVVVLKLQGSDSNSLKAIGSGEALVFKDGNVTKAKWQQTSANERIKIVDETNNQIPLNRGDTWFSAIPSGGSVSY